MIAGARSNTLFPYDPASDSWAVGPPLNRERMSGHAAVSAEGILSIWGGGGRDGQIWEPWDDGEWYDLRDWPGLYRRAPGLTLAMAIFLFSLMGIPPLVGFMGKLYVFAALIERGTAYYCLAIVGALNAAVAAYYYARVLKTMIIEPGDEEKPAFKLAFADAAWVTALALANFVPVLFWSQVEGWTASSLVVWAAR